jgi:hypothetical protein
MLKDFEKEYFFDILPAATRGARRSQNAHFVSGLYDRGL